MTGAPLVTWTVQGDPVTWLGHHSARVVCAAHATLEEATYWEPLRREEIFEFEYDMGQRIVTIAQCRDLHPEVDT